MSASLALPVGAVLAPATMVYRQQTVRAHHPVDRLDTDRPVTCTLQFNQDRGIYGEGDDAEFFYKVMSGVVRTCRFLSDGRRQIDAFHVAGDLFGFEAGTEYSLTAEAVTDCTVASFRRQSVDVSRDLFAYAMRGMLRAQEHALLLGRRSAVEKVAAFLLDCAARARDAAVIELEMTRQDIADYLGLTIETVSRTLSMLEKNKTIAIFSPRRIRLCDRHALELLKA
ncbi:helix-turn-helix domain-containing protein [Acidisoma cladoniae]|jgi:CRP/FNR family nitrogen fixation transcriptional regulator|uniref:helix-turn-helix domain-containing protein n=1 Tax=Acidisoma cladoniae TaxID=3040935 RepID=UPI00254A80B4|nr:helix-turn-helix domain-containing protein [Acidisoma sp. PAMC 29798]